MSTEPEKTTPPPYLPFRTFKNFIAGFRDSSLPGRIDKSVMTGQSGGTKSSLMQAFRFLKLIQADGTPTDALTQLVKKPEADAKKDYADLITKNYGFVSGTGLSLATATDAQLEEVFRNQGLSGDTVRKAMTFFVLLATEAGMNVSPHLKAAKRKPSGKRAGGATNRPRKKSGGQEAPTPEIQNPSLPPAPEGFKTYTLDLTADGKRFIRMTAPLNLKEDEVERVKGWMGFQFNVDWKKGK